jgi:hypothetical protein
MSFTPQFMPKIEEKIQKTGAQFYKGIKNKPKSMRKLLAAIPGIPHFGV